MTKGTERDESTPGDATAVAALYDAFAQPLYHYAWSLVGNGDDTDDPAATSVHDALVAGTLLEKERADPTDLGPWLYALVRAACQRHGLTHTCPYGRLATVPAEAPVAHMYSRLPASHRELVELTLRHALPTTAVARILSLDPQICGELSRSAIRRASEGLREALDEEGERPTWRTQLHEVSSALSLLRPPGPPPGLREHVTRTCSEPALAAERERLASAMGPLTEEGYPVHRARTTAAEEEIPPPAASVDQQPPRTLPTDRLTTADHPVYEEYRADLESPHDTVGDQHGPTRRRRALPAVSGLLTVTLAVFLWVWSGSIGTPPTVIDAGPPESEHSPLTPRMEATSTAVDNKPAAQPSSGARSDDTDAPERPAEASGEERPTDQDESGPDHLDDPPEDDSTPAAEETPPAQEPPSAQEEVPASPERAEGGENPEDTDEGADAGRGLFEGLLGLLFGE